MIIWIYRNYIFISVAFAFNPRCLLFSWCDYWWMLCASTRRSLRGSKGSNNSSRCIERQWMQIRHAKSSRIATKNETVILQAKNILLIVNSFPEIYYYYFWLGFFSLFLMALLVVLFSSPSSLLSSTSIDLIYSLYRNMPMTYTQQNANETD